MADLNSKVVVQKVIDRLDNTVPMVNGNVLLEPIVRAVLDVLDEHNFLEVVPVRTP